MYIREVCWPALGMSDGLGRHEKKRLEASGEVKDVPDIEVMDGSFVLGDVFGDLQVGIPVGDVAESSGFTCGLCKGDSGVGILQFCFVGERVFNEGVCSLNDSDRVFGGTGLEGEGDFDGGVCNLGMPRVLGGVWDLGLLNILTG